MILEYLIPTDFVWFFRTSKRALSHANLFCHLNPLHFYRCNINPACTGKDERFLMIALSTWPRVSELDTRWRVVRQAADLAKLLPFVEHDAPVGQKFNPRAPVQPANHQFGLHENFLDIPFDAKAMEVYSLEAKIIFVTLDSTLGNRGHSLAARLRTSARLTFPAQDLERLDLLWMS